MWHPTNYGSLPPKPPQGDPAAAPPVDWGEAAKWWAAATCEQQVSAPNWPQHSSYVQPPTFNARFVNANTFSSPNGTGAQTGIHCYAERPFGWHPAAQRNLAPAWNPRPGAGGWQRPAAAPAAWGHQPPSSAAWQHSPAPVDAWSQPGASANWRGPWRAPVPSTAGWPPDVGPFPVSTRFPPPPIAPNYVAAAVYPQKVPPSFVNPPHGVPPVPAPIAVPPIGTNEAATTVSTVSVSAPSVSKRTVTPEINNDIGIGDSGPPPPPSKRRTISKNEPALSASNDHHHSDTSQSSAKPTIPNWLRDEIEKRERELWKNTPSAAPGAAPATSLQKAAALDDEMDLEDAHGADQTANAKRKSRWEEADAEDDGDSSTRSSSVHSPAPSSTRAAEESGWETRRRGEATLTEDNELHEDLEMLRNSLIRTWMTDWFADVTHVELRRLVAEVIAEMRGADGTGTEQRFTLSAFAAYASDSENEDEQAPTPELDNKIVSNAVANSAQRIKQESDGERPTKHETHGSQQTDDSTKKADAVSAQRTETDNASKRRNEALNKSKSSRSDEKQGEHKSARKKGKNDSSSARRRSVSRSRSKSRSSRSRSRSKSRSRANRSRTQKSRRRHSRSRSRSKSRSRSRSRSSSYRRRRTSHSHRHGRR